VRSEVELPADCSAGEHVEYERGVVVAPVRPLARCPVVPAASRKSCRVERVHLFDARRGEREVARHPVRLVALDREGLVLVAAVPDAKAERSFAVVDEPITERRECRRVERTARSEIRHRELRMIDRHGLQLLRSGKPETISASWH